MLYRKAKIALPGKYRLKNLSGVMINISQLYVNSLIIIDRLYKDIKDLNLLCRFIEDSLKVVNIIIEQIRLKMITIKCQIRKVKLQLRHREQLGEALRVIDFEQLKIENQICVQKIDEKTQYLLGMKRFAGKR